MYKVISVQKERHCYNHAKKNSCEIEEQRDFENKLFSEVTNTNMLDRMAWRRPVDMLRITAGVTGTEINNGVGIIRRRLRDSTRTRGGSVEHQMRRGFRSFKRTTCVGVAAMDMWSLVIQRGSWLLMRAVRDYGRTIVNRILCGGFERRIRSSSFDIDYFVRRSLLYCVEFGF